jgi:hypothetical protein
MKRMVEDLEGAESTYGDIGAKLAGKRTQGFHHDRLEIMLAGDTCHF